MRSDTPFEDINFGDLPAPVNDLLQQGIRAYRSDRLRADGLFRHALTLDPAALPAYLCLYKIHTYQGRLVDARAVALAGMAEAACQSGWASDWQYWSTGQGVAEGPARFALYTLKALAFIALRDNRPGDADAKLAVLRRVDPAGAVGWPVIAALAEGIVAEAVA